MPKLWIDFTALRSRARFEPVLTQYGLTPLGRGPQKTLLCPFHDETEPSCKVNLEKRAFHCFGCGTWPARAGPPSICSLSSRKRSARAT